MAIEIGEGRFKPRPADITFHNLYGDCKDKVTLARAMLKTLEIPSYPTLIQTSYPVDTGLPTSLQFNHCILVLPLSGFDNRDEISSLTAVSDSFIFIDPTYEYAPAGYLYPSVYGNRVLLVSEKKGSLIKLENLSPQTKSRHYSAQARFNDDKSLTAEVSIKNHGHQAVSTRQQSAVLDNEKLIDHIRQWLSQTCHNPRIEDFIFQDFKDSSLITFNLSVASYIEKSGELLLLKADFLHTDRERQLKKGERVWPVYFGPATASRTDIEWLFDHTFAHYEKNDSGRYTCRLGKLAGEKKVTDSTISIMTKQIYSGETVPKEEYSLARDFENALRNCYNRKFILTIR